MSKPRRLFFWSLRAAVVIALVAIVAIKSDLGEIGSNLGARSAWALLLGLPISLLSIVAASLRYAMLVRTPHAPLWVAFKGHCLALGLDMAIPARLSEFLKVIYLRDKAGVPASVGIAGLFTERVADVPVAGMLILWAIFTMRENVDTGLIWAPMGVALAVIVLLPRYENLAQSILRRLPVGAARPAISRLVGDLAHQMRTRRFLVAMTLGAMSWFLSCTLFWVLIEQGGAHPVGFMGAVWVMVVTSIGRAIPALPAGLGTYEAAAVYALSRFGYSFEQGLAMAIVLRTGTFAPPLLIALIVVATEKIGVATMATRIRELVAAQKDRTTTG